MRPTVRSAWLLVLLTLVAGCGGGGTFVGSHADADAVAEPDTREFAATSFRLLLRTPAAPAGGLVFDPPRLGFAALLTAEAVLHAPTLRTDAAGGDCAYPDEAPLVSARAVDMLRGGGEVAAGEASPAGVLCDLRLRLDEVRLRGLTADGRPAELRGGSALLYLPLAMAAPAGPFDLELRVDPAAMLAAWDAASALTAPPDDLTAALGQAAVDDGLLAGMTLVVLP